MTSLDDFEAILKEVVQAKRLSASKMGKLTEIALRSMNHDTQIVSILYRTHKSLPTVAKVSSLYVFDALSRAARHQANKQGLTGDINSETGNCATFLLKVEGVLEGLFQDMIMVGSPESKEKTKKILDIWAKGNTFPPPILSRLAEVVKEAEKEPEVISVTTSDPRAIVQPPGMGTTSQPLTQTPILPGIDPQSTLLALLTQAANATGVPGNGQTTANTPTPPQLDPTHLAVLQQLAQTAQLGKVTSSQTIPVPVPPPPPSHSNGPFSSGRGPSRSPNAYKDEAYGAGHKELRYDRYDSTEGGRGYDDYHDDHGGARGGFRGRSRGRGRGDGRGRWDDRGRFRDRDWSPPRRARRSRSRSPPSRYGVRRDIRPYSPPRRPSNAPLTTRGKTSSAGSVTATSEVEKDEFGRDIRPKSPNDSASPPSEISTQPPPAAPVHMPTVEPPHAEPPINHDQMSLSPLVAANTSSGTPDAALVSNTVSGMEKFDRATFDFTAPASWEALGKMWQVTYGYAPSTEELMHFVISSGNGTVSSHSSAEPQKWVEPSWGGSDSTNQSWRGGRGRGAFSKVGGRGGYGHGNTRDGQERWNHGDIHNTDAIVLGGGGNPDDIQTATEGDSRLPSMGEGRSGGPGGRMQRVGDKWVFVRDPTIAVP